MRELEKIAQKGTEAVKRLRLETLRNGYPFMINSKDLPGNQSYFEYPDGSLALVALSKSTKDFTIIRTLLQTEADNIREKYNLTVK